jgi:hypothetical protein
MSHRRHESGLISSATTVRMYVAVIQAANLDLEIHQPDADTQETGRTGNR